MSAADGLGDDVPEHLDVLIIGAGLSGVGAAHHLQQAFPERSYALLEARGSLGGTWDLFRYPGIRSDSDMVTLGYRFRPWTDPVTIADGSSIRAYVTETAARAGIDQHIRYHHRAVAADWSWTEARWHVTVERTDSGETIRLAADFLMVCTGYYRYDEGYTPPLEGAADFAGRLVHPQHWPEDLDHAGMRVVVIGSGATAVTLVPAMAETAAHVTMLQRSPTYIVTLPSRDEVAARLARWLPPRAAYQLSRAKNIAAHVGIYQLARRRPTLVRRLIRQAAIRQLPEGYDVDTHLNPRYDPWDQRLCIVPDGDLFRAIRRGSASIVTDQIDRLTPSGVRLASGTELEADIVVTATGLNLLAFGGIDLSVEGTPVSLPDTVAYKGLMLSGVPNLAYVVGYTNASWTLKADLVSEYVVRLLRRMQKEGATVCVPEADPDVARLPLLDFAAGYVRRSVDAFPRQGDQGPWRVRQNFYRDAILLRFGPVADRALHLTRARTDAAAARAPKSARRPA